MKKILLFSILLIISAVFSAKAQTSLNDALDLLHQKNYVAAMDVCNTLLAEASNSPSALGARSQIHTAMGRYDLAMQDADRALSIDSKSDRALFAKAEALYYGQKNYNQALKQYDDAIKANVQMAEAYSGKVRSYMALQNNKDALKVAEDALKKFSNDLELNYLRGQLNFQQGKFKLAIDDYDKVQSINANWNALQVYINRGLAYEKFLKPDQALQDFTSAIAADPNSAGGYMARGNLHYSRAKYTDAAEDYKKAEILNPDSNVIAYNIGMAYSKIDDKASACRYFQKSCQQGNADACKQVVMNCSAGK